MDKQAQDELWNELSEEHKKKIKEDWQMLQRAKDINDLSLYGVGKQDLYKELFGSHNLNPKQIKTWEDVAIHKSEIWDEVHKVITTISGYSRIGNKLLNKLIATIQIQKLIELGYGGMVSKEEWRNKDLFKWNIVICIEGKPVIEGSYENWQEFISFHTKQQAEEFMSHESNRKLVEQYYMM